MLAVLTLVNDDELYSKLEASLARCSGPMRLESCHSASSIAAGYNALARLAPGTPEDVLCFVHQDVELLFDPSIIERYFELLPGAGILGFCGSAAQRPGRPWHDCPPCFGGLLQGPGPGTRLEFLPPLEEIEGLGYTEVQTLDGYCLFVRRSVFEAIGGFDEEYLGWHGYDLDICLRALAAGYRNYVIYQPSYHGSRGRADQSLGDALSRFERVWKEFLERAPVPASAAKEVEVYRWLRACVDAPLSPSVWIELADAFRRLGDHAGSYWAAKRALSLGEPWGGAAASDSQRARPHDLLAIASWYMGLREESREHAFRAVALDPYDQRLIDNYVLILDLLTEGRTAEGQPLIDVVILSYAKTAREYEMTKSCIRALRASSPEIPFRVYVVETNEVLRDEGFTTGDAELFAPDVTVVIPGGRFGYNAFLQAGFEATAGSEARYFMVLNNDVALFSEGFLRDLLGGLESADSVSPFDLREERWGLIDPTVPLTYGFEIHRTLAGWCLMFDKRILEKVSFADLFPSELVWYEQDIRYGEVLREHGFRHVLVSAARTIHLGSVSRRYLGLTLAAPKDRVAMLHTIPIRHTNCAEVGVARGEFAREILSMQPASLLLVDPWRHQDESVYPDDPCNVSDACFEEWYREVVGTLGASERVTILREPSPGAARHVEDAALDFVYIDAIHTRAAVESDMRAWWPKLRPGGWLAGHDYQIETVRAAVERFCKERHVPLGFVTAEEPGSWAIQVPSN